MSLHNQMSFESSLHNEMSFESFKKNNNFLFIFLYNKFYGAMNKFFSQHGKAQDTYNAKPMPPHEDPDNSYGGAPKPLANPVNNYGGAPIPPADQPKDSYSAPKPMPPPLDVPANSYGGKKSGPYGSGSGIPPLDVDIPIVPRPDSNAYSSF